jgi:CRP-like cAMP-binding protein
MTDATAHRSGDNSFFQNILLDPALGAQRLTLPAGTVLYEASSPANFVHFVHRGQVRVYQTGPDGSTRLAEILGPGEWCGTAALAQFATLGTRAVAVTASHVTQVPAEQLLQHLAKDPRASLELIQQLAGKVKAAREEAALLVFDDCHNRLVKTLVRFSRSAAATPSEGGVVLRITHQQLAQAVGVARETVSLALTQLREKNLLRTGRNQLMFDPDVLRKSETARSARVEPRVTQSVA